MVLITDFEPLSTRMIFSGVAFTDQEAAVLEGRQTPGCLEIRRNLPRARIAARRDTAGTRINGVYRAGFATSQEAYEEAFFKLFETLDLLDEHLGRHRYLTGHRLTEADWRLFTTLLRFDVVYVGHFKCNLRRIADYPNLSEDLRDLYQVLGVADTVDMRHIKGHYYHWVALSTRPASSPRDPSWTLLFHMGVVDRSGRWRLLAQVQKPRRERHNALRGYRRRLADPSRIAPRPAAPHDVR